MKNWHFAFQQNSNNGYKKLTTNSKKDLLDKEGHFGQVNFRRVKENDDHAFFESQEWQQSIIGFC